MIRLENVGVIFPDSTHALRGANFELGSEQITAIIGPPARASRHLYSS